MAPKHSLPEASSSAPKRKKSAPTADNRLLILETTLNQALESSASLNPLVDLLALAESDDAGVVHKAIYALYRVFVVSIDKGMLSLEAGEAGGKGGEEENVALVRAWLRERWEEYINLLGKLMHHEETGIRTAALEILMALLKPCSSALSKRTRQPRMDGAFFRRVVSALLLGQSPASLTQGTSNSEGGILMQPDICDLFLAKWLSVHDDVRWFFLREATGLLQKATPSTPPIPLAQNLLSLLERLNTMPTKPKEVNAFWIQELASKPAKPGISNTSNAGGEEDPDPSDWLSYFEEPVPTSDQDATKAPRRTTKLSVLQSLHHLPSHRAVFSECWLALLPHLTTPALASRALSVLHKKVLPNFTRPLRLMDWIAGCVDHGGVIGLLALNALFTLMKDHNLDYPDFYKRLYAFLTRDVLHLKYRARFFRLTELFLSSTHLPVALLASFLKRLSRLSLSAPPSALVLLLPLTYNILKAHPSLMPMLHREPPAAGEDTDPFDPQEPDPMKTNALGSSLWELASHREHYLASVSTMARILSEPFTKPSYALEDFLDHTYGTMFETEIKRKIKRDPALAGDYQGEIFPPATMALGMEKENGEKIGDVVAQLWGFGVMV
ncbi:CBF-domain-containing protein [Dacryopinax primogenitus]|uniref:CBF-domain-containing protein n=1 Tax=Dacryopinax primogenitus (strain DJM 731) TaxID=1858805 RepID=M5G169_DACPD|nr:CBF-domain-containing protein [Dacryopinax primogenitus]EJT99571.1 CBF-domain-containing protein [Dacryopinax primogenitus]